MTVVNFENPSESRLPARTVNLMFCLTHDDFSIEKESRVDRERIGKTCRSQSNDQGWDTRTSGGNQASPIETRRSDASKPASPLESCDDRSLEKNLNGFDRTRSMRSTDERNLIRDSAIGITPRVVVPRYGGAGHG